MDFKELFDSDIKCDLVEDIMNIDLSHCSNSELMILSKWTDDVRERADLLTVEDEIVGYTYNNLGALMPKITSEESRRGIVLVKTRKFKK